MGCRNRGFLLYTSWEVTPERCWLRVVKTAMFWNNTTLLVSDTNTGVTCLYRSSPYISELLSRNINRMNRLFCRTGQQGYFQSLQLSLVALALVSEETSATFPLWKLDYSGKSWGGLHQTQQRLCLIPQRTPNTIPLKRDSLFKEPTCLSHLFMNKFTTRKLHWRTNPTVPAPPSVGGCGIRSSKSLLNSTKGEHSLW